MKWMMLVMLSACFANAEPVNGPDGQPGWYSIECRKSRAHCIEKAGEVCPSGYEVADSSNQSGFTMDAHSASSTFTGTMLVKCR